MTKKWARIWLDTVGGAVYADESEEDYLGCISVMNGEVIKALIDDEKDEELDAVATVSDASIVIDLAQRYSANDLVRLKKEKVI